MPPNTDVSARHTGDYTPGSPNRLCRADGCERAVRVRGLCKGHYRRWNYCGDVLAHIPIGPPGPSAWHLQWQTEPDETAIERAMSGDAPASLLVSERQLAIARLTERGLSAKQIAERLGCTERTVQRHRSRLRAAA